LLPVLLITVIATALGALVTRDLYADPEPVPPAAVQAPPSEVPLSEQPGSPEVRGSQDSASNPLYNTLRALLQRYFDAINAKDYKLWSTTVTQNRLKSMPKEKWDAEFHTTTDGNIFMHRIEVTGDDTARVLLQFTSVQDLGNAPLELLERCINWDLVWAFERERGQWLLGAGVTNQSPQHEACASQ
jgi:hypothetical protein